MSNQWSKLFLMSFLAMTFLFAGCGNSAKEDSTSKNPADGERVLRIGTTADFAPFEFQDETGTAYVGFDMDLARAIAKEMNCQADIQNLNFDGLIPALDAGNVDIVISGMSITEERQQKVAFSNPYYKSGLTIVVGKDNAEIKGFKDLEGKSIAVQIGTTGAMEAKKIPNATVKEFNSSADTFMELKAGGVDAVVNDRPVNDYFIVQNGSKDVKVLEEILTAEEYGVAVTKKNPDMLKEVNTALEKVQKSGEYEKIFEKWFGKKSE